MLLREAFCAVHAPIVPLHQAVVLKQLLIAELSTGIQGTARRYSSWSMNCLRHGAPLFQERLRLPTAIPAAMQPLNNGAFDGVCLHMDSCSIRLL